MKDKDAQLMMEALKEAQWGSEPSGSYDTTGQQPAQPAQPAQAQQTDVTALLATQSLDDFREEYGTLTANDPSMLRQFDKAVGQLTQVTSAGRMLRPDELDGILSGPLGSGVITRFGDPSKAARKHFETLARAEFGGQRGVDAGGPNRKAGSSWETDPQG